MDPVIQAGEFSLAEMDLASLEQRVRRLENAVADLQEKAAQREPLPQIKAGPVPMPPDEQPPAPPEDRPDPLPPQTRPRPPWLLVDLLAETRAMVRMFFDRRYHVGWTTRLLALLFLPMILTSEWWFPLAWIPLLGPYLDKVLDFLLAFLVYKVLSREVRRYRESLSH